MIGALDRPVFVVGPPRSGTTVVQVALSRHPDLHVTTETHLFDRWVPEFPGLRDGDEAAFHRFWATYTATEPFTWLEIDPDAVRDRLLARSRYDAGAVMAALLEVTSASRGVSRVGEKTPDHARHLGELLAAFPDARVVYVLRDPRGAVASELRLERDWASDDPWLASERWRRCAEPLDRWGRDERVTTVRYEQLVRQPEQTLRAVCRHVRLPWHDALLRDEGGHPTYRHGDLDPWGAIATDSLGAWRTTLDRGALAAVAATCGPHARKLGYPSPLAELAPWDRLTAGAQGRLRHGLRGARSAWAQGREPRR